MSDSNLLGKIFFQSQIVFNCSSMFNHSKFLSKQRKQRSRWTNVSKLSEFHEGKGRKKFLLLSDDFYLWITFDIKTGVKFYFIMISSSSDKKRETIRQSLWRKGSRKVLGWWWWSKRYGLRYVSVSRCKGFCDCRQRNLRGN